MRNVEAILAQFQEIAAHPQRAVAEHQAETGKGAIGIMPIYAPEELVHATGYLPVGLWGGNQPINRARTYLPPFACSVMQQVMELECQGAYLCRSGGQKQRGNCGGAGGVRGTGRHFGPASGKNSWYLCGLCSGGCPRGP